MNDQVYWEKNQMKLLKIKKKKTIEMKHLKSRLKRKTFFREQHIINKSNTPWFILGVQQKFDTQTSKNSNKNNKLIFQGKQI